MPLYNRLSVVVALVAIGLLASLALTWPARDVDLYGLSFTLSGKALLSLVLVGLACTGTDMIVRQHPKISLRQSNRGFSHCILPATSTTAAWVLLAQPDSIQIEMVGVLVTCGLLALLITAEYYVVDWTARWRALVQYFLRLMAYLVPTLLYIAIRLGISAPLTAAVAISTASAILAWKLLGDDRRSLQQAPSLVVAGHTLAPKIGHCVVGVGVLLGFAGWLFNLWMATPLLQSLVLVVFLYVGVGIARHFLLGDLTQRLALEYLLVGAVVLLLLLSYAR